MRRTSIKIGLAAVILALILAGVLGSREPSYQDQPLSVWLERLGQPQVRGEATEAIRQIGPEALPCLKKELLKEDSAVKLFLENLLKKQSLVRFTFSKAATRRDRAIQACAALGPVAKPAIPELAVALGNGSSSATRVLEKFGLEAIPALAQALTNAPGCAAPYGAAQALGRLGAYSRVAVTNLAWELDNDQITYVRSASAHALSQICLDLMEKEHQPSCPEVMFAKAALIRGLAHPHWATRFAAASSIAALGTNGLEAQTSLVDLLDDENPNVRRSAAKALEQIGSGSAPLN